jgi:hypothetical protein
VTRFIQSFVLALCLIAASLVAAQAQETLTYEILRDGSVIGEQVVVVEDGRASITQQIEVKALFVTLYSRSHSREETWEGDRIVKLTGKTNDDGDSYELAIEAVGEGYERMVNGKTESFGGDYGFAPDWSLAAAKGHDKALSAQTDEVFDPLVLEMLGEETLGEETLELPSGRYEAEHWRSGGAFQRELWYDKQGRLLRMTFESRGSDIEYRRK